MKRKPVRRGMTPVWRERSAAEALWLALLILGMGSELRGQDEPPAGPPPGIGGPGRPGGPGGARGRPPGGGSRSYKLSGVHGLNGGQAVLTADAETLTGDLACDSLSSIAATLQNGTTLTGAIQGTALTMDATSTWKVTADSIFASLSNPTGASGNGMTNICGNGHEVRYDANLPANSWLGGKAYDLASGGHLLPRP